MQNNTTTNNSVAAFFIFPNIWVSKNILGKALFSGKKNCSRKKGISNSLNFEGRQGKEGNLGNMDRSRLPGLDA